MDELIIEIPADTDLVAAALTIKEAIAQGRRSGSVGGSQGVWRLVRPGYDPSEDDD